MAQTAELIFCPNEQCSFRLNHGRAAEYRPGFETCSNCGTALAAGTAAQATRLSVVDDALPLGKVPWTAIAVTAVAPLAVIAADWILLPGLDHSAVREFLDGAQGNRLGLTLGALGATPYVIAFALVELVAALVPGWRHLRTSGVEGRERLGRVVAVVGILLALVQGFSVARWLESVSVSSWDSFAPPLMIEPGPFSVVLVAGTLTATSVVFALVAGWVTRWGVMNGWAAILLSQVVLDELGDIRSATSTGYLSELVTPGALLLTAAAIAGVAFGTVRLTRRGASGALRHPAGGLSAAMQAGAIVSAGLSLVLLAVPDAPPISSIVNWAVTAAVVVPLSVAFAVLWNQPVRIAEVLGRADASASAAMHARAVRRQLPRAIAVALMINIVIVLGPLVFQGFALTFIQLSAVAFATALVLDLVAEVRSRRQVPDLVSIWPMHRTYAVAPVAQALEKAGIFAFIRGERFRMLAPFLDSYVPMEIFVPAAEQERAREVVASILAPEKTAA